MPTRGLLIRRDGFEGHRTCQKMFDRQYLLQQVCEEKVWSPRKSKMQIVYLQLAWEKRQSREC